MPGTTDLAHPPDDAARRPATSHAAQRAFPWPGTQLGLDGRDDAPAACGAPLGAPEGPAEGGRPESILGPQHGVSHNAAGPVQLDLPLGDREAIPQLSMFARLDQAHALHSNDDDRHAQTFASRAAKCHRTRRKALSPVPVYRTDRGGYKVGNLVRCGHWACPACGPERARHVSNALGAAVEKFLASGDCFFRPDVWMLTLTIPHLATDQPGAILDGLFAAWEAFTRSTTWRTFRKRWGLASVVRVLDVTFGGRNGCHPHFHVALFARNASYHRFEGGSMLTHPFRGMNDEERRDELAGLADELRPAWADALRSVGVTRPIGDESVDLAGGERASSYFTAWGLADEVGATPVKQRSHLRLLDAAAAGYGAAGEAYTEFCAAVAGRQWVSSGLGDLLRRLELDKDALAAYRKRQQAKRDEAAALRGEPVVLVRPFTVEIPAYLYSVALRVGWGAIVDHLEAVAAGDRDPQRELDAYLTSSLRTVREPDNPG